MSESMPDNVIDLSEYRDMRDEEKRLHRQDVLIEAAKLEELEMKCRAKREKLLGSIGLLVVRGVPRTEDKEDLW